MKLIKLSILIAVLLFSSCCNKMNPAGTVNTGAPLEIVSLDSVLQIVDSQYNVAMNYLAADAKVQVCTGTLTFDASNTNTADGNLSILIFKPSYTQTWNHETTVTFNLAPNPAKLLVKPTLQTTFEKAIVQAAQQYNNIKTKKYFGNLSASSFSVEVDFVITRTGELDLSLLSDVVGIGGKIEKDVTQKINLTFAEPGNCPK